MAVDGDIALTAGADQRGEEFGLGRVRDVVEIDAVEVALKERGALEGEVGVGEGELRDDGAHVGGDLGGAGAELVEGFLDNRIVGVGGVDLEGGWLL